MELRFKTLINEINLNLLHGEGFTNDFEYFKVSAPPNYLLTSSLKKKDTFPILGRILGWGSNEDKIHFLNLTPTSAPYKITLYYTKRKLIICFSHQQFFMDELKVSILFKKIEHANESKQKDMAQHFINKVKKEKEKYYEELFKKIKNL
ncbi:MAG: hypothetical protein J6X35_03800 [Bacteroidales bacterium]|nr:hypothetical protein [Bacteroidales bacterium]